MRTAPVALGALLAAAAFVPLYAASADSLSDAPHHVASCHQACAASSASLPGLPRGGLPAATHALKVDNRAALSPAPRWIRISLPVPHGLDALSAPQTDGEQT